MDIYINEFYKKIDIAETDIFVKLDQSRVIKLELLIRYPQLFVFIEVAYKEKSNSVKSDIEIINAELTTSSYAKVFANVDASKFKDGLNIEKCINIIIWTADGLAAQLLKKDKILTLNKEDYHKAFDEADVYMDVLKNCFYK